MQGRVLPLPSVRASYNGESMKSETPGGCSIVIHSTPLAVAEVCREVLSKLKEENFNKEDIFAVHLSLEEAFFNAVKHGNKMDQNKKVKIDYSVKPDKAEISLTDEGSGFDPNAVPDPRYGENLYKTEGRGLFLMRSYMDEVKFSERGNCVYMVKYKSPPGKKAPCCG